MNSIGKMNGFAPPLMAWAVFLSWPQMYAAGVSAIPTHGEIASISINLDKEFSKAPIHTFALTPDGRILAACGGSTMVYQNGSYVEKVMPSAIFVLDNAGEILDIWRVGITPQALSVDQDGSVYAAGQGRVIKLDKEGRELMRAVAPHVQSSPELMAVLEGNRPESEPAKTATQEEKKTLLKSILDNMQIKSSAAPDNSALLRKLAVNGMAVSRNAVYITCPQPKGYGFAIYQMTKDLQKPEMVTKGLSGCCGQMDISSA